MRATWIAGIVGGGIALKKFIIGRRFIFPWLVFWSIAGGVGYGNVFYPYAANLCALRTGSCVP
ncbi:MAG: hypothetical protein DMG30_06260 [Acidobacteria bacterium]|nr:MAG: hypothetical protein DMG30_06260 [Acidobacteriota bacterium]